MPLIPIAQLTTVFCCFRVPGYHAWKGAPAKHAYLAHPHRHEFHVELHVKVEHDDRDVEFILLKTHAIEDFKKIGVWDPKWNMINFGNRSCEMLANELCRLMSLRKYKVFAISVSEDGENGATVQYE